MLHFIELVQKYGIEYLLALLLMTSSLGGLLWLFITMCGAGYEYCN